MARARALIFASALVIPTLLQAAPSPLSSASDDRWGWAYCAPPYPPACVQPNAKRPPTGKACEKAVDAYVAAVFRYRTCLSDEMQRSVREANKAVQTIKCPKDKRYCYGLAR